MLYITDHPNERDLYSLMPDAHIIPLLWGDFVWQGVWTGGSSVSVCCERKRTRDLINCIQDGRHLKQVSEAREAGYDHIFLIWEMDPMSRPGDGGLVELRRGKNWETLVPTFHHARIDSYLFQLQLYAGVHVFKSLSNKETARMVQNLHKMYTLEPEHHVSLKTIHTAPPPLVELRDPGVSVRIYKELKGVGYERAKALAERFSFVADLIAATSKEIAEVEGVGKKTADSIKAELGHWKEWSSSEFVC